MESDSSLLVKELRKKVVSDVSFGPKESRNIGEEKTNTIELLATEENKFDISNSDDSTSPIQQKITIPSLKIEKLNAK